MRYNNNVCQKCGGLFKGKDNGQSPQCPNCKSRLTRLTTAIEDYKLRQEK